MIAIVPFEGRHLKNFNPGPFDRDNYSLLLKASSAWEQKALVAVDGDLVLGIGGMTRHEGRSEVWLVLSEEIRCRPVALHRIAKQGLAWLERSGITHVEVTIDKRFAISRRWAARLGFREVDETDLLVRCVKDGG